MDRNVIYSELMQMQSTDGISLIGPKDMKNIKLLPDYNLEYFYIYAKAYISKNDKEVAKNYVSIVNRFLTHISKFNCDLKGVNQELVNSFFEANKNHSQSTINNYKIWLSNFFSFFYLLEKIDLSQFKGKIESKDNKIISAEKLSKAKEVYRKIRRESDKDSEDYKTATKSLFVLEMLFSVPLSMNDIGRFHKEKGKYSKNKIYFEGETYDAPASLISLIEEMYVTNLFFETNDITSTVNRMKKELSDYDMGTLTAKKKDGGAKATRDAIFWACPQCGEKYEAVAENWCVKQYTPNGENWVVCRENCANG